MRPEDGALEHQGLSRGAKLTESRNESLPSVDSAGSVLIVENQAHLRVGHFPVMFAELADSMQAEGCAVKVLTSRGWALQSEIGSQLPTIDRLGRLAFSVYVRGKWFDRWPPRRERWLSRAWRDAVMALASRRIRRKSDCPDMIVTSISSEPWVWIALAGPGL